MIEFDNGSTFRSWIIMVLFVSWLMCSRNWVMTNALGNGNFYGYCRIHIMCNERLLLQWNLDYKKYLITLYYIEILLTCDLLKQTNINKPIIKNYRSQLYIELMQFLEFSMLLTINLMVSCNPVLVLLVSGGEGGVGNKKMLGFFSYPWCCLTIKRKI